MSKRFEEALSHGQTMRIVENYQKIEKDQKKYHRILITMVYIIIIFLNLCRYPGIHKISRVP